MPGWAQLLARLLDAPTDPEAAGLSRAEAEEAHSVHERCKVIAKLDNPEDIPMNAFMQKLLYQVGIERRVEASCVA